jgi:RND family efflux transporter MFP subunit
MKPSLKKSYFAALLIMVLLGGSGILSRAHHLDALKRQAKMNSLQKVIVFSPASEEKPAHVELPGNVVGYRDASLYARSPGYVKAWFADIGTEVNKGDLIARIETPELDAQVRQAKSDLSGANAEYALAKSTLERWKILARTRTVSKQDLETRQADEKARKAALDSAQAHLKQLLSLQSFEEIRAPFTGRITARNVDIGDLVQAAPSGRELFHIADGSRLRIFVQVPQAQAGEIRVGMHAKLSVPEKPGKTFDAEVIQNAEAMDPNSRASVVELIYDNAGNDIKPGDYASVSFMSKSAGRTVIPITSLIFRGEGLQVATVDKGHRIRLIRVVPGRDFGKSMEILSGIGEGDLIVDNPPDSIMEGQEVSIASVRQEK